MKMIGYTPKGVCSKYMEIVVDDNNIIQEVNITGGCAGNTLAVSRLLIGMSVEKAKDLLSGVPCGKRVTSCPNELSKALQEILDNTKNVVEY